MSLNTAARAPAEPPIEPIDKTTPLCPYFSDIIGNATVSITVGTGTELVKFTVHKELLCKKVEYFDKMFNGAFIEGSTQAATFPEDHAIAFKLFISWLYLGTISPLQTAAQCGMTELRQLCRLFVLAEKYNITLLADDTMNTLRSFCRTKNFRPNTETIALGYKETSEKSKLRIFLARCCAFAILNQRSDADKGSWSNAKMCVLMLKHPCIMTDIMPLLRQQAGKYMLDPCCECSACDYHQHAETEPCPHKSK